MEKGVLLHHLWYVLLLRTSLALILENVGHITDLIKRRILIQGVPVGPVLIGDSRSVFLVLPPPLSVHRITLAQVKVIVWTGCGVP